MSGVPLSIAEKRNIIMREIMDTYTKEIQSFIEQWAESPEQNRRAFIEFKGHVESRAGVSLSFHPRPGLTYSLRASHARQKEKPLFVMVDVIEGDPRWLSVCFYGEMITDHGEKGDFVPGGLLGQDARCFDVDQYDEETINYVKARMDEAYDAAAR
jgi:hypothetical protein